MLRNSTVAERLKMVMRERNLKQVDILKACELYCEKYGVRLEKNDLSQYISGKVEPGPEKLSVLSMALNVSEVWLLGYDLDAADIEKLIEKKYGANALTTFSLYSKLDSGDQGEIRGEIKQMLKADKYLK